MVSSRLSELGRNLRLDRPMFCLIQFVSMDIIFAPSPNYRPRPADLPWQQVIQHLVIHYTEMNLTDSLNRLRSREADVSCHYVIDEEGAIYQLVADRHAAHHAGKSFWRGVSGLNATSIGIELVNRGHANLDKDGQLPPYPGEQLASLIRLCHHLILQYPIGALNVVGHSDIAPTRKIDPGEHFPWLLLAEAGIGLWPPLPDEVVAATAGEATTMAGDSGAAPAIAASPKAGVPAVPLTAAQAANFAAGVQALRSIGYDVGGYDRGGYDRGGDPAAGEFDTDAIAPVILAFQRRWLPH
ncbi:MAG: N-acetylmuramoyl-L-alanine amidase, partial [Alphaproteobacteria bacterium]|nr:N-acetylmuramoyl-L-alanine amidase [Alphaproteobacteria bacterium]